MQGVDVINKKNTVSGNVGLLRRKNEYLLISAALMLILSYSGLMAGKTNTLPELKTSAVPQWGNLKGFDILPCPKKVAIYDNSIPVDDNLAILIGKSPSVRSKTAAEDLRDIIKEETSVDVPVVTDGENTGNKNLIVLGTASELPRISNIANQPI